jgi:predicted acyltransferase
MPDKPESARIASIDALRGFDMFWITGGDAFFISLFTFFGTPFFLGLARQLDHPAWTGFHFYDLIMPLFLFIVGLSMPFSLTKRVERGDSKRQIYFHVFRRAIILYILGLIYNGLFDFNFETLRYTGVLHRIAFTYLFAALIVLNFKQKGQLLWAIGITAIYWLILLLVPVPGYGAYNLTSEGNLCAYIDRLFLPGSWCCYTYGDNEGLLSNFAAIVNVIIGALAGYRLMKQESTYGKMKFFIVTGSILTAISIPWNLIYPINKYLWTASYVSLTTGLSLLAFWVFYWLIDVKGYTRWAFPFKVIGMNCITIYVITGIFDFGIIARIFIHGFYTEFGAFQFPFYECCVLSLKWLFLYFLYRQKVFLKV